jgi:hypothetical protein
LTVRLLFFSSVLMLVSCRTPTERLDIGAAPDALTKNTMDRTTPAVTRPEVTTPVEKLKAVGVPVVPAPPYTEAPEQKLTVPPSRTEVVPDTVPLDELE